MEKVTLHVHGMSCGHCEAAVANAVHELPGIKKVKASHRKKEVLVEYDSAQTNLGDIRSKISEQGYEIV